VTDEPHVAGEPEQHVVGQPEQHAVGEPEPHAAGGREQRRLVASIVTVAFVSAAIGSLGAPLITRVATSFEVSLDAAQWTLTVTLFAGAIAVPVLGRLGAGPHRRTVVLATVAVVWVGSVLTVVPLPFGFLLVGRAAQGVGLGLGALMIGVARDHLPEDRATSVIALVAVASTIGIGVGYPLAGLLADAGGVRAAYGLGVAVTTIALVAAWRAVPLPPPGRSATLDVPGALVLGAGLFVVLLLASETDLWRAHLGLSVGLVAGAIVVLGAWVVMERRAEAPLVDVHLAGHRAVAGANATMAIGGVGMYLLLTLLTRYAQTPRSAGYGFGLSTFESGLVLVPFSALGFVAGRLVPHLRGRIGAPVLLATSALVVCGGFVCFAVARRDLVEVLVAMGLLGFGVGSFSAAMPGVILTVTPVGETASAMGVNQVVRSVGFAFGSALGGLVLAAGTPAGQRFPTDGAYRTAAVIGIAVMALSALTSLALARRRSPTP
jgi:predicted MFS family arabinose efflux permease